jgi:predicted nucleic acid-binding protein
MWSVSIAEITGWSDALLDGTKASWIGCLPVRIKATSWRSNQSPPTHCKYLVDANVLSEPTRPSPDPREIDWLRKHEREMAVDPVILGELQFGILILPKGRKRSALERRFEQGARRLECLPWDADTGLRWAELLARLRSTGKAMTIKDSMIASTALVHDLVMVTRNKGDFANAGVRLFDPFTDSSSSA